jgi:mitotic spindle assembly checkpoint protein MAD1
MSSRKVPLPSRPVPHATASRLRSAANSASSTSTTTKRDSLAAELERGSSSSTVRKRSSPTRVVTDPHLSTAKRQQRTHALNTTLSQAALERRLAAAEATRLQLETHLRERDTTIERLEADRRLLAEREQEEREERERLSRLREEEKVSDRAITITTTALIRCHLCIRQRQTRKSAPCAPH